jgi:hypothetical protein
MSTPSLSKLRIVMSAMASSDYSVKVSRILTTREDWEHGHRFFDLSPNPLTIPELGAG